jgi:hypothetical protein
VHRVVSSILEANDLGTLRGHRRAPIPARTVLQGFGFGSGDVDEGAPELWDPDATGGTAARGTARKEWNLLVVNDDKVVNAMAAPGKSRTFKIAPHTLNSNEVQSWFLREFSQLRRMNRVLLRYSVMVSLLVPNTTSTRPLTL